MRPWASHVLDGHLAGRVHSTDHLSTETIAIDLAAEVSRVGMRFVYTPRAPCRAGTVLAYMRYLELLLK